MKIRLYGPARALCAGCGRALEEIAGWNGFSDERRRAVMAELPDRLKPSPPAN